jgi:N-acetylglucosamine-6-phosphate deacetylase
VWITNVRVVTPDEVLAAAAVRAEGGRIAEVCAAAAAGPAPGEAVHDGEGRTLLPGFLDLHNHGALGSDFMDGEAGTLEKMSRFLARHGVTGFLATTTSAPAATLSDRIALARDRIAAGLGGAQCLGLHLEGPYLSAALAGMHPAGHCRRPDPGEYSSWFAGGVVRRMTASLELPGGERLLADAGAAGVLLSLGHTSCTAEDVRRWADAGLRHVTHLYNTMSRAEKRGGPVRVCGCVEGALADPRITCEVIGDGHHVPEHLFRVAALCKGAGGITICSDATLLTGAVAEGVPTRYGGPEGRELVVRDGRAVSLDGTMLVGSIATLGDMVARLLGWLDGDWRALARITSTNAAALIGLGETKGRIQPGGDADLVLVDDAGRVAQSWVAGIAQIGGPGVAGAAAPDAPLTRTQGPRR